jgi:hypothetical protein
MTKRSISLFLLVVGLLWGLIVTGLFALIGGFFGNNPPHDPALIANGLLTAWPMFIGPLLMVIGSIFVMRNTSIKVSTLTTLAGCIVLNIVVGNHVMHTLQDLTNPLIGRRPHAFDIVMVVVALLTDAAAVQLYRLGGASYVQKN